MKRLIERISKRNDQLLGFLGSHDGLTLCLGVISAILLLVMWNNIIQTKFHAIAITVVVFTSAIIISLLLLALCFLGAIASLFLMLGGLDSGSWGGN
ncbi:hypothetical protein AUK11_00370 [bacterium CG2_30_37_16]|nr:MAG: hypothetical protein AUK11_00370 [bacterium CG2_30_37_16]PIP31226.1 MAG: hypothetical protein COX25_00440 [bacterium (Candidatus Howlettbacteria) CG23_combo_of_CG06-09_8_20_14_all_37_9]PIY00273.1 MAG: hypothetical protein COZ22_00670 [bacterium (Candidatus Howlettbacteria) CG_4_10_14_3_um_filter_37_10]PJB06205.1 MAG: hypothetical protein CO123_02575 [bacterium (Candidatus Howlettbacteria) CG_4_9_14_3_um_filter_37_10]